MVVEINKSPNAAAVWNTVYEELVKPCVRMIHTNQLPQAHQLYKTYASNLAHTYFIQIKKEWAKLEANLGGIKNMDRVPDCIFVVDPKKEKICVQEAHRLGITLIGIGDTNCDPEELDYIIPGNDDAIRAVKLIVSKMADAVIEARQGEEFVAEEMVEEAAEATDIEEVADAE